MSPCRSTSAWKRAAFALLFLVAACDSAATTPPVVENVSYVTNVYTQPQMAVSSVAPEAPEVIVSSPEIAGIPACDAFFAVTESCARNITSDPAALAQFEGKVQVARSEALRAETSRDPGQIAHAASACMAAASAYRMSPCG